MEKKIYVDPEMYPEVINMRCEKCNERLLLFVHKDNQKGNVTLGCGFCGYPNELTLKDNAN